MLQYEWVPEPIIVGREFYKAAAAVENLEIPLTLSIPAVAEGIQQIFAEEGPGWAPWADSYAPYAEVHNIGILDQTGDLMESTASPGNYAVAEDTLAFTGEDSPDYWGFHQRGTSKMPARPFIGLTEESEQLVVEIFDEWLAAIIASAST